MIFILFLAVLILSGDYFSGSIIHKILHNGYSGAAIVAGVMLPYCMYVITDMYRREREGGKSSINSWKTVYYMINVCLSIVVFGLRRYKK